jgi:hypothetical protein
MNRNKLRAHTKVMKINVTARGSFFSFLTFRVLEKKKKFNLWLPHQKAFRSRARNSCIKEDVVVDNNKTDPRLYVCLMWIKM